MTLGAPFVSGADSSLVNRFDAARAIPQATNRDGKTSSPAALSSIDSVLTMVSKQQSHFRQRMTILMLTPILGPFGGNYLIVALNAGHPEGGTKIGFYHRWNLNVFDSARIWKEVTDLWQ